MDALLPYLDFVLRISPSAEPGQYMVKALSATAGEASGIFIPPFSELELENFILKVGRTRRGARRIHSPEWNAALSFGSKLYNRLFQGDVQATFVASRNDAVRGGKRLRLKIVLDAPALANYPWEFLYDPSLGRFLTLYEGTPLVRYIDLPIAPPVLRVASPLKILILASSPEDLPGLDIAREKSNLDKALGDLVDRGLVSVEWIEHASLEALRLNLLKHEVHVIHFIGHGYFDEANLDGMLAFEDEAGRRKLVSGEKLAVLLGNHPSIRLAILNSCEGGRSSVEDPFSSSAAALLRSGGLAAVVAMQFEITDAASIAFTSGFYSALAQGRPVDTAITQARLSIFTSDNDVEWATPVLYLRSPDGIIFTQPSVEKPFPTGTTQDRPLSTSQIHAPERPTGMEPRPEGSDFSVVPAEKDRALESFSETAIAAESEAQKPPLPLSLLASAFAWSLGTNIANAVLRIPIALLIGILLSPVANLLHLNAAITSITNSSVGNILLFAYLSGLEWVTGWVCGSILRRKTPFISSRQHLLAAGGWVAGWAIVEFLSMGFISNKGVLLLEFFIGLLGFFGGTSLIRVRARLSISGSVFARIVVVILLFSGALGPWFQVESCTIQKDTPPEVTNWSGKEVLFNLNDGFYFLIIPLFFLFAILILRILWPRLNKDGSLYQLEWVGAATSNLGLYLTPVAYLADKIQWGYWLTIHGSALMLLILSIERFRKLTDEPSPSASSPPVSRFKKWWRWFWRRFHVVFASGLLLVLLIRAIDALIVNP